MRDRLKLETFFLLRFANPMRCDAMSLLEAAKAALSQSTSQSPSQSLLAAQSLLTVEHKLLPLFLFHAPVPVPVPLPVLLPIFFPFPLPVPLPLPFPLPVLVVVAATSALY